MARRDAVRIKRRNTQKNDKEKEEKERNRERAEKGQEGTERGEEKGEGAEKKGRGGKGGEWRRGESEGGGGQTYRRAFTADNPPSRFQDTHLNHNNNILTT